MKQDISSLMDGELDSAGADRVIRTCCGNPDAARAWQEYHLIGDALRGQPGRESSVAARVAKALEAEPTVLAPRASRHTSLGRVALAAAASVATIAVVGWIGTQGGSTGVAPGPTVAVAPAAPASAARPVKAPATAPDVHDYLVAHRQIPSAEFYKPVAARQP